MTQSFITTTTLIISILGIFFTGYNIYLTRKNLFFLQKKDFQDKLFDLKKEAYIELNKAYYNAQSRLDINSSPFTEIYKIKDKDTWSKHFEEHISLEYHNIYEIRKLLNHYSIIIDIDIYNQCDDFCNLCESYITSAYHFDTELIINNQDSLVNAYFDLLNSFRNDLNIPVIEGGLRSRIIK